MVLPLSGRESIAAGSCDTIRPDGQGADGRRYRVPPGDPDGSVPPGPRRGAQAVGRSGHRYDRRPGPRFRPGMVKLSVNINKIATVRNSRGGRVPSVLDAVGTCVAAGAPGITVHPRADARHITAGDVRDIARELAPLRGRVEFNIEGDPRPDFVELVEEVRPDQCTLVPVRPGEITSQAGWPPDTRSRRAGRGHRAVPERGRPGQPVRRSGGRADSLGSVHRRAARRAVHGALRARLRGRRRRPRARRSTSMPAPPAWPRRWGSRSTPGTTWTWTTWCSSAACRTWPRCRSATRSSATRCSSASTAACAITCACSPASPASLAMIQ